tara:strand:+ start:177 stop:284 length:108 start_codon:yes stop_codon:yes gene_type:complete
MFIFGAVAEVAEARMQVVLVEQVPLDIMLRQLAYQ